MELSSSNTKKNSYILLKETSLYFPKINFLLYLRKRNPAQEKKFIPKRISYVYANGTQHFSAQAQRITKYTPRKFLVLQKTKTS